MMTGAALATGRKRGSTSNAPWQKVKFDRQIIAIAKSHGARTIYTTDEDVRRVAVDNKLEALGIGDLKMPPVKVQAELPFEAAS